VQPCPLVRAPLVLLCVFVMMAVPTLFFPPPTSGFNGHVSRCRLLSDFLLPHRDSISFLFSSPLRTKVSQSSVSYLLSFESQTPDTLDACECFFNATGVLGFFFSLKLTHTGFFPPQYSELEKSYGRCCASPIPPFLRRPRGFFPCGLVCRPLYFSVFRGLVSLFHRFGFRHRFFLPRLCGNRLFLVNVFFVAPPFFSGVALRMMPSRCNLTVRAWHFFFF